MSVPEIKSKLLEFLQNHGGKISSNDLGVSQLLGIDISQYSEIQAALVSLRNEGRIQWFRTGDGSQNQITLVC
jgi:hypothetical protein